MMNIIILREPDNDKDWMELIEDKFNWLQASIIILLKKDGTYQPVKNRYGSPDLVGIIGVPLDLTIIKEEQNG